MTTHVAVANPIRSIREMHDYSIEELAKLIHVNPSLLYLVERGCYNTVPKRIYEYFYSEFLNEDPYEGIALQNGYHAYQRHQRFTFGTQVQKLIRSRAEKMWEEDGWNEVTWAGKTALETSTKQCWLSLLEGTLIPVANVYQNLNITRTAFCKAMCVQPSQLYSLEVHKVFKIPESLLLAFEDAYFPDFFVDEFQDRMDSYFGKL